uniref:Uncharacterized protein n=1 Tax=Rhizophora mucronata TaxID=61149 RepID=A0A2P2PWX7_RHIMU
MLWCFACDLYVYGHECSAFPMVLKWLLSGQTVTYNL